MSKKAEDNTGFVDKLAELEKIVEWFEGDVKDVDESLAKFERGVKLGQELKDYLAKTENKVTKIREKFDVE